ncbi:hypothetical protein [Polyangium sp. y55x31]|uniref:hypothetical protein n=1 Tax=Polyangium sp. y55x31 TaxID=3042688 RepID=UPI002482D7AA|nr:hypothetical protein [Polyangium sp. y55x31]MDI1484495.1 hypothetical protein [Polyangium sp. y55x31]
MTGACSRSAFALDSTCASAGAAGGALAASRLAFGLVLFFAALFFAAALFVVALAALRRVSPLPSVLVLAFPFAMRGIVWSVLEIPKFSARGPRSGRA